MMQNKVSRRRVLVIDDIQDIADTTAELLTYGGYDVKASYKGSDALHIATIFLPEVILLDIGMPEMDGFEVLAALQKLPFITQTRIIAYTSWGDNAMKLRALNAGFDTLIVKPATFEEILLALNG